MASRSLTAALHRLRGLYRAAFLKEDEGEPWSVSVSVSVALSLKPSPSTEQLHHSLRLDP